MRWKLDGSGFAARYAVCVALLAASFVVLPLFVLLVSEAPGRLPSLLPRGLGNLLFFWPQYFLLPSGLEERATGAHRLVGSATFLSIGVWLALLAAYVRLTRRLHVGYVLLGLFPGLAVTLQIALGALLPALGFTGVLDGP